MTRIFGGGLAGLLAGCLFPDATIFEAGSSDSVQHKAVLRFRSSAVGDAVGIEFRKVRVHKGVWYDGQPVAPSIQFANWYSKKVINKLADRSIWNLEPADRWIAPEDFLSQLARRCNGRIKWNTPVSPTDFDRESLSGESTISTLPMPIALKFIGRPLRTTEPEFKSAPIVVKRWRISSSDVYQTIYFPGENTNVYRASITGDLLIAEYVVPKDPAVVHYSEEFEVFNAFGLSVNDCTPIETVSQRFGKIAPIDDAWRKQFIFDLTHVNGIYSLGRFGTWRNILLDDVLHDIAVIKKLMNVTTYDRARHSAGAL